MYKEGSGYDSKGKEGWKGWIGGLGKMRSVSVGPQVILIFTFCHLFKFLSLDAPIRLD